MENKIARMVKIADATHNFERSSQIKDQAKQNFLKQKYQKVIELLKD